MVMVGRGTEGQEMVMQYCKPMLRASNKIESKQHNHTKLAQERKNFFSPADTHRCISASAPPLTQILFILDSLFSPTTFGCTWSLKLLEFVIATVSQQSASR
jgi:hypothetical protein